MTANSPISQVIANLTDAMDATRDEIASINARIETVEAERQRIEQAPPHSSDIVAAFMDGLDAQATAFRAQLASNLAATFVNAEDAVAASTKAANLLTIEANKPTVDTLRTRVMSGTVAPLNMAALAYLLRDRIADELPDLVDKLCPLSRQGMKRLDREAALAEVDATLGHLRASRDAMQADLHSARLAIMPRQ